MSATFITPGTFVTIKEVSPGQADLGFREGMPGQILHVMNSQRLAQVNCPIGRHGMASWFSFDAIREAETQPLPRKESMSPLGDPVIQPVHYGGDIECIDAIRAALTPDEFRGFLKGNVIKYAWRERGKAGDQDLAKAAWYARLAAGDDPRKERP